MRTLLPDCDTEVMQQPSPWQMCKHGILLHISTLHGALHTSASFRQKHPQWKRIIAKRFISEYGMNLMLLIACQFIILSFANTWQQVLIGEVLAVLLLPFLSVVQVFTDNIRGNSVVVIDADSKAGMSVRVLQSAGNDGVSWVFFNHHAFPVGRRKGERIRSELHRQAQQKSVHLLCHAQNAELTRYYLAE